jgi:hypothetical protein
MKAVIFLSLPILLGLLVIAVASTLPATAPAEAPWASPQEVLDALPSIPLTKHAQNGHVGQYNAVSLIEKFALRRDCRPILVYFCPSKKQVEVMCILKPEKDLMGGVIIGYEGTTEVITGFAQKASGWKHAGCLPPMAIP